LSKGTRQKVALAGALVHEPRLIILDEPFTGLDAASARLVKNVLRERIAAGCSVVMTTHILEVAERMADRIGVMCDGRLIAEGTLDELRRQAGAGYATLEDTFLALTGSDTSSNALFGGLQKITAQQLNLSPILMCATNSAGGVMGKMVDAQSICIATAATNQVGNEGSIFRFLFWHSVALAAIVGIIVMLYAYVFPHYIPNGLNFIR